MENLPYVYNYFEFSGQLIDFLFYGWNSKSTNCGQLVWMCVTMLVVVVLLETLRTVNEYLSLLMKSDPVIISNSVPVSSESSPLLSALRIPPSNEHVKKYRLKLHLVRSLLVPVQLFAGYMLMLAIMSYNAWIFLTVILGSGIVFFFSSHLRRLMVERFKSGEENNSETNELTRQSLLTSTSTELGGARWYS